MTREPPAQFDAPPIEAGRQVAHLRHLLARVEEIAGTGRGECRYHALDEAARISAAYERSLPVARRRFDALAEETAGWAAAAVETLLTIERQNGPPRAAAAQLARELQAVLGALARVTK